jgi:hypothetical protein
MDAIDHDTHSITAGLRNDRPGVSSPQEGKDVDRHSTGGEDDKPIPGIPYRILLTDGTTKEGILDREGSARVDDIDPGTCVVTFPELDQDAWEGI